MNDYSFRFRLTKGYHNTDSTTPPPYWPKDIFEKLPAHSVTTKTTCVLTDQEGKTTNDWRFGCIIIDWIDLDSDMSTLLGSEYTQTGSKHPQKDKFAVKDIDNISLNLKTHTIFEGSTLLPEGVVHIYRHSHRYNQNIATFVVNDSDEKEGEYGVLNETYTAGETAKPPRNTDAVKVEDANDGTTLAVLAVPSYMTPLDFMTFIVPASDRLAHLRMIRDSSPNRSIVLLKFRARDDAALFSQEYNGRPFNVLEPSEICHIVSVMAIKIESNDAISLAISRLATAQSNLHELPSCPVCLERMDTSVTGLVTVPCSHTFHCMCLSKWGDSRCPVCRYSQNCLPAYSTTTSRRMTLESLRRPGPSLSVCFDCSSASNLWICLICGNVGCGRYGRAHAHAHHELTMHLYSLELESQRVWDYAGDGYVHRLIQNKADGKLVELPSAVAAASSTTINGEDGVDGSRLGPTSLDSMHAGKMEAIGIEYSYLLTSQLDSQRAYYEQQKDHLEKMLQAAQEQIEVVVEQREFGREEVRRLKEMEEVRRAAWEKEKGRIDKRCEKLMEVTRTLERELKEERTVSQGLMKNLEMVKMKAEEAELQRKKTEDRVGELEEQVRDLMIYLDVKDKIAGGGDSTGCGVLQQAAGGTLEIPQPKKKKKASRKI